VVRRLSVVLCYKCIKYSEFSEQSATNSSHRGQCICDLHCIVIPHLDILFIWNYRHKCSQQLRECFTLTHLKTVRM
jgi:hypothetical protein